MNTLLNYFKKEKKTLIVVTITGLIYNVGLLLGPLLEGKAVSCLYEILVDNASYMKMLKIICLYLLSIFVVQGARFLKRKYVRQFANNTNKRMKDTLYSHLLNLTNEKIMDEGVGNLLTKAISDVDDCSEGMRKFVTEIFDTGIAIISYVTMLIYYDWHLALLCLMFTPFSYILAKKMKVIIQKNSTKFKETASLLSEETLDMANNVLLYRVYGRTSNRKENYQNILKRYEKDATLAELPVLALPSLYKIISLFGVFFIVYFGSKNVLHVGYRIWDIATFTAFLSYFMKTADKTSKVAKLFNSISKAEVSWDRIKDYMKEEDEKYEYNHLLVNNLTFDKVSFNYSNSPILFKDVSFNLKKGEILGVTGHVASGKTSFGRLLLNIYPYKGNIYLDNKELRDVNKNDIYMTYLGHNFELFNDTIANNISLGENIDTYKYLKLVCLDKEVEDMKDGINTIVGDNASFLSGGQAQRLALARTLAHASSILVLDDPFSALDKNTEEKIFENIKREYKDKIIILISHRLSLFSKMDKVLYIENSNVYIDKHEVLLIKNESYKRLVNRGNNDENKC